MKKSFSLRWISLLLAVMMVFSILPLSVFAVDTSTDDTRYTDFLSSLTTLEGYADAYAREHSGEDATALVINYIRCGVEKYTSSTWTTFCGPENTAFTGYVSEQDAANGTNAAAVRSLEVSRYPMETKSILRTCSAQWIWRTTPAIKALPTLAVGPAISVTCFSLRPMRA